MGISASFKTSAIVVIGLTFVIAPKCPAADNQYSQKIRPVLETHCLKCHSGEKPKGDLLLEKLGTDFNDRATREQWQAILERMQAGEMPPKSKPRPSATEIATLSTWITTSAQTAAITQRATQGRVVMRRLNRTEYENTVHDLLAVDLDLKELLPLDTSANGFDNVGDALHTSSFLMEKYLEAADTALNAAIVNGPKPKSTQKRSLLQNQHSVKLATEKVYRKLDDAVVMFSSSHWNAVSLSDFYPSERGHYRFRISTSAFQSDGKPVVYHVWAGNGGMGGAKGHLVGFFDAPADKPAIIEWTERVEPRTGISILPYGLAGASTVDKIGADNWKGPGLAVQWIEVEGPLNGAWPPESHRRIFGDLPQAKPRTPDYNHPDRVEVVSSNPVADATRILHDFARRAFRRTVGEDEIKPYVALFQAKLAENRTFEQAIRASLLAIMVSPDFLFLREKTGKLDDFALASRLSYFLWSSMPDEELITLAEKGELHNPEILLAQVDRLLNHPKAAAFAQNFLGQWLALRDIDFTEPSQQLYPEYDLMLRESMIHEPELFFAELLKNDLSISNIVASDFSILNGRLAKHYGIPGVAGWQFQKVALPPESHRGGFLTMAAVLKVTANGTSTSPVIRGAWVLDRILGTPPPRPPADVGTVEPDTRGTTTIREQLAKHRQIASCASCHKNIDPPGFALESFDVIGGWRENYRSTGNGKTVIIEGRKMNYLDGKKIDPSDIMPDGRAFKNIDEFKQLLLENKGQIARALTERLLTYATGGPPDPADRPQISAILRKIALKNDGLRSLIHEIVQSELFQTK